MSPDGSPALQVVIDSGVGPTQSDVAVPVYGYAITPTDGRGVLGNIPISVRIIRDADLKTNGGGYTLDGHSYAMPIMTAPSSSIVAQANTPLPVYPINGWGGVPVILTLQPNAATAVDNTIVEAAPTTNNGARFIISAGADSGGNRNRGLVKFDVSSIPVTATILSATLTLTQTDGDNAIARVVGAHRALTQWYEGAQNNNPPAGGEDASTWNLRNNNGAVQWGSNTPGGLSGTDYAAVATGTVIVTAPTADISMDVTPDVAVWVAGTAPNFGHWIINASGTVPSSRKFFASSDGATPSQYPKLVVTYLP